jgi:hypothetical protein
MVNREIKIKHCFYKIFGYKKTANPILGFFTADYTTGHIKKNQMLLIISLFNDGNIFPRNIAQFISYD